MKIRQQLQVRMQDVLSMDRSQNIDALKVILRDELKSLLAYYMVVDDGLMDIDISQTDEHEYDINISVKASHIINVGKRIL